MATGVYVQLTKGFGLFFFVHHATEISVCYRQQPTKSSVTNDMILRISQTQITWRIPDQSTSVHTAQLAPTAGRLAVKNFLQT